MRNVDTECMDTCLNEFAEFLGSKKAILVLDGANH